MFKKRTRPAGVRGKDTAENEDEGQKMEDSSTAGEDGEDGLSVDELIMLRKLRKSKQGIDLEKLNRGEHRHRKKNEDAGLQRYGLQTRDEDVDEELEDEKERAKRLVRSNNFTQQTNALDVDKHMMAYIEEGIAKRKGNTAKEGEEIPKPYDPQAELYRIPERFKSLPSIKTEDEEGNLTNSLGMLSAIPEVDLGMDNRLRNIEETEKAKREMMEQRKTAARHKPEEDDFSAARFFRSKLRTASDIYAAEDAKRDAAAAQNAQNQARNYREPRHESATDEQVYERFKKR
ncbi:hepatocellular carcinoma-associated antigen 59-domain-containing protein [Kockovaella imperatae]|uniref:Hepatocellular carcinoma-associated antigen 59-domain-containing protein n=1 Tax=Kockovaella imperatae TaxID=4999 RepID=A0A1Y1UPJ9_9TREE|nr:hepatocellular carcinoma-associated antigen 59-domain-containing protein [Kockovaella imperatae]ORX39980.1 hepatocellular carcinoma-associated antigen 59-domain-containing protein [Kockovaella imperatae]